MGFNYPGLSRTPSWSFLGRLVSIFGATSDPPSEPWLIFKTVVSVRDSHSVAIRLSTTWTCGYLKNRLAIDTSSTAPLAQTPGSCETFSGSSTQFGNDPPPDSSWCYSHDAFVDAAKISGHANKLLYVYVHLHLRSIYQFLCAYRRVYMCKCTYVHTYWIHACASLQAGKKFVQLGRTPNCMHVYIQSYDYDIITYILYIYIYVYGMYTYIYSNIKILIDL